MHFYNIAFFSCLYSMWIVKGLDNGDLIQAIYHLKRNWLCWFLYNYCRSSLMIVQLFQLIENHPYIIYFVDNVCIIYVAHITKGISKQIKRNKCNRLIIKLCWRIVVLINLGCISVRINHFCRCCHSLIWLQCKYSPCVIIALNLLNGPL